MTPPTTGIAIGRRRVVAAFGCAAFASARAVEATAAENRRVPVLAYHRFAATVLDSMTVRESTFSAHMRVLEELGCTIVPLADVVAWRRTGAALPPRCVALSADDAHRSQAEVMAPMLKDTGWPVTLFVYPSAVSNADYAMTWAQLAALQATGRHAIESHTYWHPHLTRERRSRTPEDFERFATRQLLDSRERLRERLGVHPTLLAWPFGMTDSGLMALAGRLGYQASFTLGNRPVSREDELHALPRYLMTDALGSGAFARLLEQAFALEKSS